MLRGNHPEILEHLLLQETSIWTKRILNFLQEHCTLHILTDAFLLKEDEYAATMTVFPKFPYILGRDQQIFPYDAIGVIQTRESQLFDAGTLCFMAKNFSVAFLMKKVEIPPIGLTDKTTHSLAFCVVKRGNHFAKPLFPHGIEMGVHLEDLFETEHYPPFVEFSDVYVESVRTSGKEFLLSPKHLSPLRHRAPKEKYFIATYKHPFVTETLSAEEKQNMESKLNGLFPQHYAHSPLEWERPDSFKVSFPIDTPLSELLPEINMWADYYHERSTALQQFFSLRENWAGAQNLTDMGEVFSFYFMLRCPKKDRLEFAEYLSRRVDAFFGFHKNDLAKKHNHIDVIGFYRNFRFTPPYSMEKRKDLAKILSMMKSPRYVNVYDGPLNLYPPNENWMNLTEILAGKDLRIIGYSETLSETLKKQSQLYEDDMFQNNGSRYFENASDLDERDHFVGKISVSEIVDSLAKAKIGKKVSDSIYFHKNMLRLLPSKIKAQIERWISQYASGFEFDLIKLAKNETKKEKRNPTLSLLSSPRFLIDAYPENLGSMTIHIGSNSPPTIKKETGYNPPIYHRVETMLSEDDPHYEKAMELTRKTERLGLFNAEMNKLGRLQAWDQHLAERGYRWFGMNLVKVQDSELPSSFVEMPPSLKISHIVQPDRLHFPQIPFNYSVEMEDPSCFEEKTVTSSREENFSIKALVPRVVFYVLKHKKKSLQVMDFGAGRYNVHQKVLTDKGFNVTAHDFAKPNPTALSRKYDIVYASNVLNTQCSQIMAAHTVRQCYSLLKEGGIFIANYPKDPRYCPYTPVELLKCIASLFGSRVEVLGGKVAYLFDEDTQTSAGSPDAPIFMVKKEKGGLF